MNPGVETKVVQRLRAAGGLDVRPGGPGELVVSVRGTETVLHLEVKHRFTDEVLSDIEQLRAQERERVVLVVPALSPKRRQELRYRDISWIEYKTGAVHLRVPHLAIDLPEEPPTETDRPTPLPRLSGKAGVVVEALIELGRQQEFVAQADVAELSGSTRAWTSRIFGELVKAEALEDVGRRGLTKEWRPKLDELLRLWSDDEGPSPTVTGMYLWSRTSSDLLQAVGQLGADGATYAIGGVAAADLHEPTLTGVPAVAAWIPMSSPPEGVAARLGAELVDSGANVFLWQAPGDPALRMAGPLARWRSDAPEAFRDLWVVTPTRAVVEAGHASGRGPDVAENLRRRILEHALRHPPAQLAPVPMSEPPQDRLRSEITQQEARLKAEELRDLVEQATVDCYNESQQVTGLYTMIEEYLAVPFRASVLGVEVTVEMVDLTDAEEIVVVCRREGVRQRIPVLDLPLPDPPPEGWEWVEAYRHWARG
ncbi:MAG: hypothetical protein ACYC6F_10635 [Longimicrobiales bacterium]